MIDGLAWLFIHLSNSLMNKLNVNDNNNNTNNDDYNN